MATISMIFLRTNWPNFVYKVTFYSMSWFAGTLQYQRSSCDQQYLPERRSGSKIFARTAFRRVPAPLHPCAGVSVNCKNVDLSVDLLTLHHCAKKQKNSSSLSQESGLWILLSLCSMKICKFSKIYLWNNFFQHFNSTSDVRVTLALLHLCI